MTVASESVRMTSQSIVYFVILPCCNSEASSWRMSLLFMSRFSSCLAFITAVWRTAISADSSSTGLQQGGFLVLQFKTTKQFHTHFLDNRYHHLPCLNDDCACLSDCGTRIPNHFSGSWHGLDSIFRCWTVAGLSQCSLDASFSINSFSPLFCPFLLLIPVKTQKCNQ